VELTIDTSIIENLSSNGVLAYIAVKMAEGREATTPALAGLVRCKTGNMLDGIKELAVALPEIVTRARNPKTGKFNNHWVCGVIKAGDGVVLQSLESERFRLFVDDLKKYWDHLNPSLQFEMGGKDGAQIRMFLSSHRQWTQDDWRSALKHRATSVVRFNHAPRSGPLWTWVGQLDNYAAGPLNEYNRPVEGGGNGKAAIREQSNRQGNEEFAARHL
jgi:hypothetical protein